MRRTIVVLLALVALTGCGGVDWANYAPEVKTRIDAAAKRHDCAALQKEFDTADTRSDAALMAYVDAKMSGAGCY